jgi:hypothetical protein
VVNEFMGLLMPSLYTKFVQREDNMATMTRTDTLRVSADEDTRKAKEGVDVEVTFVYIDWTEDDYLNKLNVSSSPKVAVAQVLRKLKTIPDTYRYVVPKAGTKASADPFKAIENRDLTASEIARLQAILDRRSA